MIIKRLLRRLTAAGADEASARSGPPVAATSGDGPSGPHELTAHERSLIDHAVAEARHQERQRVAGIRVAMRQLRHFDLDLYMELVESGATPDEARARICGRQSLELHEQPDYAGHAGHA